MEILSNLLPSLKIFGEILIFSKIDWQKIAKIDMNYFTI